MTTTYPRPVRDLFVKTAMLALALLLGGQLFGQAKRVLFIGNSYIYSNDLPELTRQMALGLGDTLLVASSTPGGYTFAQHTTNATTMGLIAQGGHDHVVLQEQSQLPSFPPSQVATQSAPYAQALVDSIRVHSPCADPVFFMTWGRENGDAQNCPNWPPVCTYAGMQEQLRQSYLQFAQDNAAWCAPVGVAWRTVRDQAPAIPLYVADGSHPSAAGSYLAASVLYCTLFRKPCTTSPFLGGLDPATAGTLRSIASAVVLDSLTTWNIGVNDPVALPVHSDLGGGQVLFGQNSIGASTHSWDLGDGATTTDAAFTHTYTLDGPYTVTYVATDSCGRSDTTSFTVHIVVSGIDGPTGTALQVYRTADGIGFRSGEAGLLELFEAQGRVVARREMLPGRSLEVPVERASLLLWRFTTSSGASGTGRMTFP